jgi:hypothetical protein
MNYEDIGQAVVLLDQSAKQAAASSSTCYGMSGKLYLSESGWILLSVPNALVRGAFAALDEPGIELPTDDDGKLNAHISVFRPGELEQVGGAHKITERGKDFSYRLGAIRSVVPPDWKGVSRVWFIEVHSPELKKLRKTYGLLPLPHEGRHQLHVTFALRRTGVLGSNATSKAASLIHGRNVSAFFKRALTTKQMIATERKKVEEPASEEQAEAGNYRKGHVKLHGLDISIENAKGSTRSGTSPDGKTWEVQLAHDYGYIRTTEASDGDSVDVFIGGSPDTELVFVVNQIDPKTKRFDEFKCMLGFNTQAEAEEAYLANYEKGWKGKGEVVALTVPQFKWWLQHGNMSKPVKDGQFAKKGAAPAIGLPDPGNKGDLSALSPGLIDMVIQHHKARLAGPHYDVRFATPETGLYSWAARKELPTPGKRVAVFRQPLHTHEYGSFEGEIPKGYGAGSVRKHRAGKILVTEIRPNLIKFTTADRRHPERFVLLKPEGWIDDDWLLINRTPTEPLPYEKVHYKKIDGDQVEKALDKLMEGDTVEAKIDGASSLVRLLEKGVEVTSYRASKETGGPITHTERFFGGPGNMEVPPDLVGTILKGELYGTRKAENGANGVYQRGRVGESVDRGGSSPMGVIGPQELGGILNASLGRSLEKQREGGIDLRNMIFDIQQLGKQPVGHDTPRAERRRMIEDILERVPGLTADGKFHLAEAATPEDAKRLWQQIRSGEHPLTREGVVIHPARGRPIKGKLTEERDVWLTGVFPGEGRLAGQAAGGFTYALKPGGETVGKVGTGLSDELRRELWADPESYTGRMARIRAQEQHPSGAFRAPALLAFHEDYPTIKAGQLVHSPDQPLCDADELAAFVKQAAEETPDTIAVDLDGTILKYDGWKGEDHFGEPRVGARKALKELQRQGKLVIINTCRGNTKKVKEVLFEHDIPFDFVNENPNQPKGTSDKIQADVYVDDRAVDARKPWSQISKELQRRLKAATAWVGQPTVVQQLREAKARSDAGDYRKKHQIMRRLLTEFPDQFAMDSSLGLVTGVTHVPSGFRLHVPAKLIKTAESFYLRALRTTPVTIQPEKGVGGNILSHLQYVRSRGDQAIREAIGQDRLQNAMDPNRSMRQFLSYARGRRRPIVHHWLDRVLQGDIPSF